ncbi:MAG: glycosyltransferase, partial [Chloroflexota bacterium]
ESMASGKPVVAVRRGGPLESIIHDQTGLLCPPEPAAFAAEMAKLAKDPRAASELGARGRRRAATFSWGEFVSRIDDYVDAVGRAPERELDDPSGILDLEG